MELIAKNEFTVTRELFREGMMRVIKDDYMPTAKKIVFFLAAAWLVLAGVTLFMRGNVVFTLIELVVIVAASLWVVVYIPRNREKRTWRALEDRSGPDLTRTTLFYEDRLEVVTASAPVKIVNYEDIGRILESENLLILVANDKTGIMSALDGFTKGDKALVLSKIDEWRI